MKREGGSLHLRAKARPCQADALFLFVLDFQKWLRNTHARTSNLMLVKNGASQFCGLTWCKIQLGTMQIIGEHLVVVRILCMLGTCRAWLSYAHLDTKALGLAWPNFGQKAGLAHVSKVKP